MRNLATKTAELLLLDFEASGLGPGSYPVEVGWTVIRADDGELLSGPTAIMIAPHDDWPPSAWDPAAEAVHGISQAEIVAQGRPAAEVARMLCEAADGRPVLVTATADGTWLAMLLRAAKAQSYEPPKAPEVRDFEAELSLRLAPDLRQLPAAELQIRLQEVYARIDQAHAAADAALAEQGLRPHRAGADALHMAVWWQKAVRDLAP